MRPLVIRSFAKLNLTFEILGTLHGGYHEVRTIFHNIDLSDVLTFELVKTRAGASFEVELSHSADAPGPPYASYASDASEGSKSSKSFKDFKGSVGSEGSGASGAFDASQESAASFPLDDTNLIVKASKRFATLKKCGAGHTLKVTIDKRIPIAAGLAGGSSNAAAALKAMSVLFDDDMQSTMAAEIAAQLGSDINFCLDGGTKIGTNRGEVLAPVASTPVMTFLLLKPREIAISTPWIYREYDAHKASASTGQKLAYNDNYSEACLQALSSRDLSAIAGSFFNAFEPVCFRQFPQVLHLRNAMRDAGCLTANITGSGPTLFGLLKSMEHGCEVTRKLIGSRASLVPFDIWTVQSSGTGVLEAHGNATL